MTHPDIVVGLTVRWKRGFASEGRESTVTEIDNTRHWIWLDDGNSGCHVADFWTVFVPTR